MHIEHSPYQTSARLWLNDTPITDWRKIGEIQMLLDELALGNHQNIHWLNWTGLNYFADEWIQRYEMDLTPDQIAYFTIAVQILAHTPDQAATLADYTYCPQCQIAYNQAENWRWDHGDLVCIQCKRAETLPAGPEQAAMITAYNITKAANDYLTKEPTHPAAQAALDPNNTYRLQRWLLDFIQ